MANRQAVLTQSEPIDLGTARLELVKSRLGASGQGLTQSEAQTRLKQYGYNELPEQKVNPLLKFLSYFWAPIPWMLTIFVTRTRKSLWSVRPATILLVAVFGAQTIATLLAVYGIFMAPIGWSWALFIWGYALAWLLVNDRVKIAAYRVFDSQGPSLLGAIGLGRKRHFELFTIKSAAQQPSGR